MKLTEYTLASNVIEHGENRGLYFHDSFQHLNAELERVDILIQKTIANAHEKYGSNDQFHGLYISSADIDRYMSLAIGVPAWTVVDNSQNIGSAEDLSASDINVRRQELDGIVNESIRQGVELRLVNLKNNFNLTDLDIDIILIVLLTEVDTRYEKIYAYLHDDLTKKQVTISLILSLLSTDFASGISIRERLRTLSPLLFNMLIEIDNDINSTAKTFLAGAVYIDKRIADYLFGSDDLDDRLATIAHKYTGISHESIDYLKKYEEKIKKLIIDNRDIGKSSVIMLNSQDVWDSYQIIKNICSSLNICMIKISCDCLVNDNRFYQLVDLIIRETKLQDSILYWENFSALLENQHKVKLLYIQEKLYINNTTSFIYSDIDWQPYNRDIFFIAIKLPLPSVLEREEILKNVLGNEKIVMNSADSSSVVRRFNFSVDQIVGSVNSAKNISRWEFEDSRPFDKSMLLDACKMNSGKRIISFSRKLTTSRKLQDIVLPEDQFSQLQDLINAVNNKSLVLQDWGFEKKLSIGKSINILFTGDSGTGKTLAAEIIANELEMDIFKIDLSSVVSKYIGETEKNISMIFNDAKASNSILFFDEADALFGKRSEVKDAQDRYANIETGYLLQKVEEHDGTVIMTTNLRNNIDSAFVRRMYAIVEFPFPDEQHRLKIWQGLFPKEVPLNNEIDYELLAKQFKLTGGHIKNIGLCAAFLSAAKGKGIGMRHLILATKRELQKLNKPCTEADFGQYFELIK